MVISAGKFKAQCLKLMDLVKETNEHIIITKRGIPVAQLVPLDSDKNTPIFGRLKGCVVEEGDIISPIEEAWNAENGK